MQTKGASLSPESESTVFLRHARLSPGLFCDSWELESRIDCCHRAAKMFPAIPFSPRTICTALQFCGALPGERFGLVPFRCSKDRDHCCCLIRDICSHAARASRAAKHNVAPQWQTSPLLSASIFPSLSRSCRARSRCQPVFQAEGYRCLLSYFSCVRSWKAGRICPCPAVWEQRCLGSVQQWAAQCSGNWGLLHENTFLLSCSLSSCLCPSSSISSLAAAVHLFIFSSFLFSVSLGLKIPYCTG